MSSPDNVALAAALVNLSVIGFIIFFGIVTIVPVVHGLALSKKSEPGAAEVYRFGFSYRLIKKIKGDNSVLILTFISLLFIITGLLSLLYFFTDCDSFLTDAILLSVLSVGALIVCISWIVLPAVLFSYIKKDDIAKIYEYIIAAYEK